VPNASIPISQLVAYGSAASASIGMRPLSAQVGVLDLVMAVARIAGANTIVSLNLGASIPGLSATQLMVTVGESAAGAAFATVGPEGTTLHSAQIRLLLTTQIGGTGLPAAITVPFYLEVGSGTARIATIACGTGASNANVTLSVSTGLVDAWIGSVSPGSFGNLTSAPAVTPAPLLSLPLILSITGLAHVSPSSAGPASVVFSKAEIQAAMTKTVSSPVSLVSTMASLAGRTRVSVTLLGATLPQPALPALVTAAIAAALTPVDQPLASTLGLLGVSVGTATTSVPGVHCGQGTLVN
jgi:uncharacterized membrane protein